MNDFRHMFYLTRVDGLGSVRIKRLIDRFGSARNVFEVSAAELTEVENISVRLADAILKSQNDFVDFTIDFDKIAKKLEEIGGEAVTYEDELYPWLLKKTYDPPPVLYCKGGLGRWPLEPCIAIVGTRRPSDYGKKIAEDFARELASIGFNIVSGFARGVDTSAHKAVVNGRNSKGKTIAVLGCGVDIVYPPENAKLYDKMCERGLLLSEFEMGTMPDSGNFPRRNRIISGLSYGSVIIESALGGGAMITARFALDQSREVFAVPGFVTSKNSEGPNSLIKNGQAKLVERVEDVLEEIKNEVTGISFNGKVAATKREMPELKGNEKLIYDTIAAENQAVHIDFISENSGLNISDCLVTLLNLEFKGLMEQLPGKRFKVNG